MSIIVKADGAGGRQEVRITPRTTTTTRTTRDRGLYAAHPACIILVAMRLDDDERKHPDLLWAALVGALGFFAGIVVLRFGFVYDDAWTILDNPYIKSEGALAGLLNKEAASFGVPDAGRPLMVAIHILEWRLFGSGTSGYHWVSLLLHVASSVMVYLLSMRLASRHSLAVAASMLFAVHPVHAEVIAVVSFREDSLACLFGLLSWYMMLEARDAEWRKRAGWALASGLCLFLGAAGKEMVLILPFAFVVCNSLIRSIPLGEELRRGRYEYLVFVLVLGLAVLTRLSLFGRLDPYQGPHYPHPGGLWGAEGYERLLTAFRVFGLGVAILALGWGHAPEYCEIPGRWNDPWTLWGLVLTIGLVALLLLRRKDERRWSEITGYLLFMAISFIPTSNLFWMPNQRADRFWYLPSVGFCLVAASLLLSVGRKIGEARFLQMLHNRKILEMVPLVVALLVWSISLQIHLWTFRNEERLWLSAVRKAPCHVRALTAAASVHLEKGKLRKAREEALAALRRRPAYAPAHQVLGRILLRSGHIREARASFMKACRLEHWRRQDCLLGWARANHLLGLEYGRLIEEARTLRPARADLYVFLASRAMEQGRLQDAVLYLYRASATAMGFAD